MDSGNPLISVVITSFNSEKFIEEAVISVLNQTFQNFEIIVVDDQSTDKTAEIVREFSAKDSRIKFYSISHSGKPSTVRNYGIAKAKGEYIAFLDGDDVWEKYKLEEQFNSIQKNQDAVLVYSASITFGANIFSPYYEVLPLLHKAARNKNDLIQKGNSIPLSTVLVSKKYLDMAGGFDEDPELKIEDFDLWLRLGEFGYFIFLPHIHAYYRIHPDQFSSDWEEKKKRLEYLSMKRGLNLASYRFYRNKGFIFLLLRNGIHFLTFLCLKSFSVIKRISS
ncbi:MAG: glycosyltransferase family 2 protein [Ignavibacteria bacterium]